jgi:hypothetical protein
MVFTLSSSTINYTLVPPFLFLHIPNSLGLYLDVQIRPHAVVFYPVPVHQADILPLNSFRFLLAGDTLS